MSFKFTYSFALLFLLLSLGQAATAQTLNVTINRKAGQANPTKSPVIFTVKFSAPIRVASFTAGTIVLSGTATGKKVTTITQVAPNNGTAFEVTVSATSGTGTIVATIPVAVPSAVSAKFGTTGNDPSRMVIDGSGNIYVANYNDNTITKITAAGASVTFAATGQGPLGITIDGAGNLYTANYLDNTVSKITPLGAVTKVFARTGNLPTAIHSDGLGNLYTTNSGDKTVSKITTDGVTTIKFGNTGSSPIDLTTDAAGNVYTANNGDQTVSKITKAGVSTLAFGNTGLWPTGIAIDGAGNLYTSNNGDENISKITDKGISTIAFATTGDSPNYMTIDGSGNLYTPNLNDHNVSVITPAGASSTIGNTDAWPIDVVLDAAGNIYVMNQNGMTVTKITPPNGIALANSTIPSNAASTSSDNGYVLPVNLVYFTATNKECTATLNWQSSGEINNSYYGIETSADGKAFAEAGRVASKNSATGATYTYPVKEIVNGTTYYRLKIVDKDGNFSYSKTITVIANGNCGTGLKLKISPNPAKDFVNIEGLVKGNQLSILNAAGITVLSIEAACNTQRINIGKFAKGTYMLRVKAADGSLHTIKFIKL